MNEIRNKMEQKGYNSNSLLKNIDIGDRKKGTKEDRLAAGH